MGFEYLTNNPLVKAREDYLNLLVGHGFGTGVLLYPAWQLL